MVLQDVGLEVAKGHSSDRMVQTTRDALIVAATDLLDKGGPAAVTLREVGHAAGLSHNAPYRHFADKSDLLAAVASRELTRLIDEVLTGNPMEPPSVHNLMLGYVKWALHHPERFKLAFGPWTNVPSELGRAATRWRGLLITAVKTAQADGSLPPGDPERMSSLLLAVSHGAVALALADHLSAEGNRQPGPDDLVTDLFRYLQNVKAFSIRPYRKFYL